MFDAKLLEALVDPAALRDSHPSLFSAVVLPVPVSTLEAVRRLIDAIESVIALPAYQARVMARAPAIARVAQAARGVFFGYDVHLGPQGPQLIEINTNAGGALLNAWLLTQHGRAAAGQAAAEAFVAMFREEWQRARGEAPLRRIAIVDEAPESQYLAPEFAAFQALFAAHGIEALIADPGELVAEAGQLKCRGEVIDLVYNRLTDFTLSSAVNAPLREIFTAGGVVLTPHPQAHALYADKRNLCLLSDPAALADLGVPASTIEVLVAGIPRCVEVTPETAESFWESRRQWFFKPAAGFGSRATYRGDKLTRRVFGEIAQGGYIAQQLAPPATLDVPVAGEVQPMKYDVRAYVYAGQVQLLAARLYQGQTTNFRTPGGGFAPVVSEDAA